MSDTARAASRLTRRTAGDAPTGGRAAPVALIVALVLLLSACADPYPAPSGAVEILASRGTYDTDYAGAAVTLRVACSGSMAIERFGATVRVDSDRRRYWTSIAEESIIPAGASTTRSLSIGFAEPEERFAEGSAVVEASWFE